MQGNPMDLFDEMDEMFARLFSRLDHEFMTGSPQIAGYLVIARETGEGFRAHAKPDDTGSVSRETGEPVAEVHRIGNVVKVVADLPGITGEALRLDVKGNTLIIDAGDADHLYRTSASLPPVDTASMQKTLKNGVLEVTFTCLPGSSEKA